MTKVQLNLLTVMAVAVGLLLGGSVLADSATTTTGADAAAIANASSADAVVSTATTDNNSTQAQLDAIKVRIQALTAQVQSRQQTPVVVTPRAVLTQAQLDQIQIRVTEIAQQTARIKAQVQILVRIRTIEARIAAIRMQLATMQAGGTVTATTPAAPVAATPASELTKEQKEARIAQIRQQIGELNQEMLAKRAAEQAATPATQAPCEGDSCSGASEPPQAPVTIEVSPKPETTAQASNPGFWQSVGNFFRKLFTF
ncbi:MAG: hypothetical protein MUD10_04015 [Candidatus Pacebacteria bacterium]|jgi:chromosome segregation ATPase|nr:hypothetical protein [Candidatus Paceibacterota bacterium]